MKKRILIVDDEKDICFLISEILKDENYHTFNCHTYDDAINSFNTEEYDLIIPKHHLDNKNIQNLLNTLIDKRFNHDIMEIPGYNIDKIGDIKCSDASKL